MLDSTDLTLLFNFIKIEESALTTGSRKQHSPIAPHVSMDGSIRSLFAILFAILTHWVRRSL